ncbi:organic hydroperoxide resistance protein [Alteribacillus bidgolensis]|uniref:Peroxiredoxin, Ohr subfamily n=1 Tax=Alteribacillus bidgolensis TaxID=930129 RepID=A0A1G8L305_9BACI|nr:organic hydroperoxide resistance protein [Alteribacillus bidgolensis]SDI50018.1 peroxiredoxin, Ohr subfamily [Alteribacillus bidgolensis]
MEPMFTSHAAAKGGREGHVKSDDGIIDLNLEMPGSGSSEKGTNPEQLFAAGYAACFDGALNLVAKNQNKEIDSKVNGAVGLLKDQEDNGFKIAVRLDVEVNGVGQEEAEELTTAAHQVCPYSKATRGNIEVSINTKAI